MEKKNPPLSYREVKIKTVNPVYAVGLTWLLYSLFLPLYRFTDIAIAAGLSVLAYIAAKRFLPEKIVITPLNEKGALDTRRMEIINKGYAYIDELVKCDELIDDGALSNQISEITAISRQMFDYAAKNPRVATDLRNFIDYYYPTTIKLLTTYAEMREQAIKSRNAEDIMNKTKSVMSTVLTAFRKQLDMMYGEKQLDIETDIQVLKGVLAAEGLADAAQTPTQKRGLF